MLRLAIATAVLSAGHGHAGGERIPLPSGLEVAFIEVVGDDPGYGYGYAYQFRFVAADLNPAQDYLTTEADLAHLCLSYALPRVADADPPARSIVISLADREVPFGASDPDAVQFFGAYTPEGSECVWQAF